MNQMMTCVYQIIIWHFYLKALLLRWIIIVYDVIEDHTQLLKFYGVVFHYMEYDTLR
jgi:centromere protein I